MNFDVCFVCLLIIREGAINLAPFFKLKIMYERYLKCVEEDMRMFPQWRYGQCLFNTLYTLHPNIAEGIRGTSFDPYHSDKTDEKVKMFLDYVKTNLND